MTPAAAAASNALRSGIELLHGQVAIGIDADFGGDGHGLESDRLGVVDIIIERTRRGEREIAAGTYGDNRIFWIEHVARARDEKRFLRVGDDEHGVEPA